MGWLFGAGLSLRNRVCTLHHPHRRARDHGVQSVGLPSRLAAFKEVASSSGSSSSSGGDSSSASRRGRAGKPAAPNWWRQQNQPQQGQASSSMSSRKGHGSKVDSSKQPLDPQPDVQLWNEERAPSKRLQGTPVCTFTHLPPGLLSSSARGPRIRLFLPRCVCVCACSPSLYCLAKRLHRHFIHVPAPELNSSSSPALPSRSCPAACPCKQHTL